MELTADDLVAGDALTLGPGDVVPADCRLLSTEALEVDESSLTGESLPRRRGPPPCGAGLSGSLGAASMLGPWHSTRAA